MATAKDSSETWDPKATYVIGHQRPDTDSIASALAYAWYLLATGQERVLAASAGHPAAQTLFALERFDVDPPLMLTSVAPTFGHAARPNQPLLPDDPLAEAMDQLAAGARVVPVVDAERCPLGVVTPMALARAIAASVGALARPCRMLLEETPSFAARERISDHRGPLLRSETDDFLVTDDAGRYLGTATRGRVLDPPRARLVLVDHNELSQAVPGAEEAEIVAVLDHHRLGNAATRAPIPFVVEPVGSTCTLVAEHCRLRDLEPVKALAGMMLSGILSDTLVFRSPTTTERDQAVAEWLANLAGVEISEYGQELLSAGPGLGGRAPAAILDADRKRYEMGGMSVSIAQVEVTGFQELPQAREALLRALDELVGREGLALACLMVTDVVSGRSRLLARGDRRILIALPFSRSGDGEWDLGEMVSRKKQLAPVLDHTLEESQ
jgi:manganese-dependent inorganic pyrophosphatase